MEPLADRLDNISKQLDTLGPFAGNLREVTIKNFDNAEKELKQLVEDRKKAGTLRPSKEDPTITNPVMEKYTDALISVIMKAGLAEKETSGNDTPARKNR